MDIFRPTTGEWPRPFKRVKQIARMLVSESLHVGCDRVPRVCGVMSLYQNAPTRYCVRPSEIFSMISMRSWPDRNPVVSAILSASSASPPKGDDDLYVHPWGEFVVVDCLDRDDSFTAVKSTTLEQIRKPKWAILLSLSTV